MAPKIKMASGPSRKLRVPTPGTSVAADTEAHNGNPELAEWRQADPWLC